MYLKDLINLLQENKFTWSLRSWYSPRWQLCALACTGLPPPGQFLIISQIFFDFFTLHSDSSIFLLCLLILQSFYLAFLFFNFFYFAFWFFDFFLCILLTWVHPSACIPVSTTRRQARKISSLRWPKLERHFYLRLFWALVRFVPVQRIAIHIDVVSEALTVQSPALKNFSTWIDNW